MSRHGGDPTYIHPRPAPQHTRRSFIKKASLSTAAAIGFPYIVPASALGREGNVAPSERIVMACIGVGSQGTGNMKGFLPNTNCQIVAVCDVDKAHRDEAAAIVNDTYENQDCASYNDFREVLDRDDIDALSLALPDHWHAIPAIQAAKRGFDMYAEKPLALTIGEGRAMVDAVEGNNVVWQTGSWQRSKNEFYRACMLVRNGLIGNVKRVKVGLPTGKACEPQPEMPIPAGFDYDFWLGPAPAEPYTKLRCHWDFRWIFDYSGGQHTDWGAHHCDIANWAMDTEDTGPIEISGTGQFPEDGLWDTAIHYRCESNYPAGASPIAPDGFTMICSDSYPSGAQFEGDKGTIFVGRGKIDVDPLSLNKVDLDALPIQLYKSTNHAQNFFDCVRSREKTVTPIGAAHRAISIAHLGNMAMKLERPIKWDPAAEKPIDDPVAERMLMRAMRSPWRL